MNLKPPISLTETFTGVFKLPPLKVQNLRILGGGFIFYKIQIWKFIFSPRRVLFFTKSWNFFARFARKVLFFKKSTANIDLFLNVFCTVSALLTAKNPTIFRALRAHDFWCPKNFPALRAGGFILYKVRKFFSRASRGGFYSLQNPEILTPEGFTEGVNSNSPVLSYPLKLIRWLKTLRKWTN